MIGFRDHITTHVYPRKTREFNQSVDLLNERVGSKNDPAQIDKYNPFRSIFMQRISDPTNSVRIFPYLIKSLKIHIKTKVKERSERV